MSVQPKDSEEVGSQPDLPSEAHDFIGRQLRRIYDDRLQEPLPDRFAKLLEQLGKGDGD